MKSLKYLVISLTAFSTLLFPGSSHAILQIDDNALVTDSVYFLENDELPPLCPTAAGGTVTTSLSGSDHVTAVYNYLTGKGLSPEQAAGVIGNMIPESGIEPQQLEGVFTKLVPADQIAANLIPGFEGWGIVQWTPYTKMVDATVAAGRNPNLMSTQLDFLWGQLTVSGLGSTSPEPAAYADLKKMTSPDDAAASFHIQYERSLDLSSLVTRQVDAIAVYEFIKNHTPIPDSILNNISTSPIDSSGTTAGGAGGAVCKPAPVVAGNGVYKNPYRDIPNLVAYRVDAGVDYGGDAGPIYAVGNAKITLSTTNYSTPGLGTARNGGFIAYTLLDGPGAGLQIYFSEDCRPVVKAGDIVTADTKICDYAPQGTFTEIGWFGPLGGFLPTWYNGTFPQTGAGANTGIDMNNFLKTLGTPPSSLNNPLGMNYGTPPATWPKW